MNVVRRTQSGDTENTELTGKKSTLIIDKHIFGREIHIDLIYSHLCTH
jgi:hypothetical protein